MKRIKRIRVVSVTVEEEIVSFPLGGRGNEPSLWKAFFFKAVSLSRLDSGLARKNPPKKNNLE